MVGGDCLMISPFLAGIGPNFLNFGKMTRGGKKRSTNSGDLGWQSKKNRDLVFGFFSEKQKRRGKGKPMQKQGERVWMNKNEGGCTQRLRFGKL